MRIKIDFDDESCVFEVINDLIHVYLKNEKKQLESVQYRQVLDEEEVEKVIAAMEVLIDWYGVPNGD